MTFEAARHILVPVDFSDLSALALRYAAMLARCSGGRITALYAERFLPPPYFTEGAIEELNNRLRESRQQADASLAEFVRKHTGPDVLSESRVVDGFPADAIRLAASQAGADLIVMGTHGHSGINRLMLGSVAEHVLRESEIPVLVVRGDWKQGEIKRILCPVNDSDAARQALTTATGLAKCTGAQVTVLHVKEPHGREAIKELCAWIPEAERGRCSVTEMESGGDVAAETIALASRLGADMLVLGARHRRFFDATVLGANTVRMLRHAPCPVLAVFEKGGQA
jgi:nucleotide-binding universal stress UspA family protein